MDSLPRIRQSLKIILLSSNTFLRHGIENMLGRDIVMQSQPDDVQLTGGRGILLLDHGYMGVEQRISVLDLVRRAKECRDWRVLNMVDEKRENDMCFSRLTGMPVVSLRLPTPELYQQIMSVFRKRSDVSRNSIAGLTYCQWNSLKSSLSLFERQSGGRTMTFYSHRLMALQRVRLRNMHKLRCIVAGCK